MGLCLSKQKTENYTSVGGSGSSKMVSGDGTQFSKSSSKASISSSFPPTPRTEGEILQSSNVKSFSFNELKAATGNFRTDSVLGEGGFGCVFKGCIDEHTLRPSKPGSQSSMVVAVKRLKQDGWQGHREWLAEINYLGQLQHPNLVKLIGYCLENDQRLLVYEFMQKGSLDNHLFRRGSYCQPLSWSRRMKIALGAARGLAFLHGTDSKVIYRDFKTSNILLDSNYDAKLSDFGLARDGPDDNKTHVTTRIMGTYGYAAPEYLSTGHLTAKSDVYSFGVVLLEILSGKRAIDRYRPAGEHTLVEWARLYLTNKRRVLTVIDARLEGQYSVSVVAKVAILALQCLSMDPRIRPNMEDAINILEKLQGSSKSQSNQENIRVERTSRSHNERQSMTFMAYPRPLDYSNL